MLSEAFMLNTATIVAQWFELAGIAAIILGAVLATVQFGLSLLRGQVQRGAEGRDGVLPAFRRTLGRSVLTGLELLVAADIIRTVAVEPTLNSVLVLGLIVIIRTFLSFSLEVEIDGRWPWQQRKDSAAD
ncbi:DUF1622 domain-containing protein [Croceibacterium mercuriale]|nr:DUF1622 domain-containing protein [Croceibacterium mercuriale]